MQEIKPTNCHYCGYCCAFLATVEDGRVVDLRPDPTRYPYDERILAGCRRWHMNLAALDGADRINHPLRRVGERGAEVTFQSGEHTSTRIRAGNSADLAQILRLMREFNPEAPK